MKKIILFAVSLATLNGFAQGNLPFVDACYPLNCDNAQNYSPAGSTLDGNVYNAHCDVGHNGNPNSSYKLLGNATSYIELPNSPILKAPSVCISVWVKLNNVTVPQYIIFAENTCPSFFEGYSVAYSSGQFYLIKNGGPFSCTIPPGAMLVSSLAPAVQQNQWYNIVFYMDWGRMWMYVNGIFCGQIAIGGQIDYDPLGAVILGGTNNTQFNLPLHGNIDDVRYFTNELTAQDVSDLYHISPACGGAGQPRTTGVGASGSSDDNVLIYPIPNSGKFTIENVGDNTVSISDITGKIVGFEINSLGNKSELNLRENKPGLYFLKIQSKDGTLIQTTKLTVE